MPFVGGAAIPEDGALTDKFRNYQRVIRCDLYFSRDTPYEFEIVDLGHRLKLFRIAADLKQADLADRLGVSKNYVYMVESGRRDPSFEYLKQFSDTVDVPLSLLFLEPANRKDPKSRKLNQKVIALLAEYADVVGVKKRA